jgi:hypothetical protein
MHPVEPARCHSVALAGRAEAETAELPMLDHPVLTLRERQEPTLPLVPISTKAELRSSIERNSALVS